MHAGLLAVGFQERLSFALVLLADRRGPLGAARLDGLAERLEGRLQLGVGIARLLALHDVLEPLDQLIHIHVHAFGLEIVPDLLADAIAGDLGRGLGVHRRRGLGRGNFGRSSSGNGSQNNDERTETSHETKLSGE